MAIEVWKVVVSIILIILSGTFSGLTLGVMNIDLIDLHLLIESGSPTEVARAKKLIPIRKHGNFLLCCLLIGNTTVNSALSIVSSDIFGGLAGFLVSSVIILYIGEIIPQAFCHKHALYVGSHAIPFIRVVQVITFVLSYPSSLFLDWFLGGEGIDLYNKRQLHSLVGIHGRGGDLEGGVSTSAMGSGICVGNENVLELYEEEEEEEGVVKVEESGVSGSEGEGEGHGGSRRWLARSKMRFLKRKISNRSSSTSSSLSSKNNHPPPALTKDEMTVLQSALKFSGKTVEAVMTELRDTLMLEVSTVLNFKCIQVIFLSGHSRIPVFEKNRQNIIGLVFTKDLIVVDPDDEVPIRAIVKAFDRQLLRVRSDTDLNKMLNAFKRGNGHLAVVQKPIRHDSVSSDENKENEGVQGTVTTTTPPTTTRKTTFETVGIVTLEDLIEELIGDEILDETDVYSENKNWNRVNRPRRIHADMLRLFDNHDRVEERLAQEELLQIANYLQENVEEFRPECIRRDFLLSLLSESTVLHFTGNVDNEALPITVGHEDSTLELSGDIYTEDQIQIAAPRKASIEDSMRNSRWSRSEILPDGANASNKPIVYMSEIPTVDSYLVLSGKLTLWYDEHGIGKEATPWTMLGTQALSSNLYAPEFTASVEEYPTRLLKISKRIYRSMRRPRSSGSYYNNSARASNLS